MTGSSTRLISPVGRPCDANAGLAHGITGPLALLALAKRPGFLRGTAGSTLAFQSAEPGSGPATDWDACLLLC